MIRLCDTALRSRSLRGRLLVLLAVALVSAAAVGTVLVQLYRQSSIDRVARAEAVVARGCAGITDRYQFYVTGWTTPPADLHEAGLHRDLVAVVQLALARPRRHQVPDGRRAGRGRAVLQVRGMLFSFTTSLYGVVAIQLLDGLAAGIFGVISVLIASDLMRGTGRFNLVQGLTALAAGIGAGLSNVVAGYVVQWFGYSAGFLGLAGIAVGALAFFALLMPETWSASDEEGNSASQADRAAAGGAPA